MTDIERYRGDTAADEWTITDSSGAAIDIAGFSFILTVNTLENPPDNSTELYSISGNITDAINGKVEFAPSALNADQKAFVYYYDLQMTDTGGRLKTIDKGTYTYNQDITKS